jgi:transcription elongation factor Elf1
MRVVRVADDGTLVVCGNCGAALTIGELVARAYLHGYSKALDDITAHLKEAQRYGSGS